MENALPTKCDDGEVKPSDQRELEAEKSTLGKPCRLLRNSSRNHVCMARMTAQYYLDADNFLVIVIIGS